MKVRNIRVVVALLAAAMSLAAAAVAMAGTFIGTDAGEVLRGTRFADTMDAKGGNDRVVGRGGDDQIDLGQGDDRGFGGQGNDTVLGGDGNDRIHGNQGNDTLDGQLGVDRIWGGQGDDTITGHQQGDLLVGGPGNDRIQGDVPNAGDLVSRDRIFGGSGDDQLQGGDGRDLINGGAGSDTLDGGAGVDQLSGGAGNDRFVFSSVSDTKGDQVMDFAAGDVIDLSAIDARTGTKANDAFAFIGDKAFTGIGQLHVRQDAAAGVTYVEGNTDNDPAAEFSIAIKGLHTFVAGDFVL